MKQDLDEMVILRLPRRNCGTAYSFNFMQVLCVCVSNVYHQMCICQKTGLRLKGITYLNYLVASEIIYKK